MRNKGLAAYSACKLSGTHLALLAAEAAVVLRSKAEVAETAVEAAHPGNDLA